MEKEKKTSIRYFSLCSCLILILGIANLTISPRNYTYLYEKKITKHSMSIIETNCRRYYDELKDLEEKKDSTDEYEIKYNDYLYEYNICVIQKGAFLMERISFNLNIIIGFISLLLGFFAYKGERIPHSSLIGLICGILGIVSALLYIIFSEILFTQFHPKDNNTHLFKREADGSVAEYEAGKGFRCYYYTKKGDVHPFMAKYSDLIKSQYNFNREYIDSFKNDKEKNRCTDFYRIYDKNGPKYKIKNCAKDQYLTFKNKFKNCKKLYYYDGINESIEFDYIPMIYDICIKLYTAMILSAFLIPIYTALILFSFHLSERAKNFKSETVRADYPEDLLKKLST